MTSDRAANGSGECKHEALVLPKEYDKALYLVREHMPCYACGELMLIDWASERELTTLRTKAALCDDLYGALMAVKNRLQASEFPDIMPFTYYEIAEWVKPVFARYDALAPAQEETR